MRKILRLFAAVIAVAAAHAGAHAQQNTILTGVEGLQWGASRAEVEARFGVPDSVHARGDTINLIYAGRSVAGKRAKMMDVLIVPGEGLSSVAYLIQQTPGDCTTTFDAVVTALNTSLPRLRAGPREVIAGGAPAGDVSAACRTFDERGTYSVIVSQTLRDPVGPANVFLFSVSSRHGGTTLVVQLHKASRPRPG